MTEVSQLFDTPLIVASAADAPLLMSLRQCIDTRLGMKPGRVGGMAQWCPAAIQLLDLVIAVADQHSVDIGSPDHPRYRWAADMEAEVAEPGNAAEMRCRPGAFWSAIYYVKDGYAGNPDRRLGGELVLEDPRMPTLLMEEPELRWRLGKGIPAGEPSVALRPAAGKLLLFPGWVRRSHRPLGGPERRVCVNIDLVAEPVR